MPNAASAKSREKHSNISPSYYYVKDMTFAIHAVEDTTMYGRPPQGNRCDDVCDSSCGGYVREAAVPKRK